MIGIDTNILVDAHGEDPPQHSAARAALAGLVESDRVWAVPWACVHEFLAIVTHPRIHAAPTTTGDALAAIRTFLAEGGGRTADLGNLCSGPRPESPEHAGKDRG